MVVALPDRERKQIEGMAGVKAVAEPLKRMWEGLKGEPFSIDPSLYGDTYAGMLKYLDRDQVLDVVNGLLKA